MRVAPFQLWGLHGLRGLVTSPKALFIVYIHVSPNLTYSCLKWPRSVDLMRQQQLELIQKRRCKVIPNLVRPSSQARTTTPSQVWPVSAAPPTPPPPATAPGAFLTSGGTLHHNKLTQLGELHTVRWKQGAVQLEIAMKSLPDFLGWNPCLLPFHNFYILSRHGLCSK